MMNALIKDNQGVQGEDLTAHLRNNKFVPMLIALWSERDRAKRLNWLRAQSATPHALLLFELAIAEFAKNPKIETLLQISYPLLKTASLRVRQDGACYKDKSLANLYIDFEVIYQMALNKLCQKQLKSTIPALIEQDINTTKPIIVAKFLNILQLTQEARLPLPDWLLGSGSDPKPEDRFPLVGFLERCKTTRLAVVQKELATLLTPPYTRVFIDQD